MLPEFAHLLLILALLAACAQAWAGLAPQAQPRLTRVALAWQVGGIAVAFALLGAAFVQDDFSVVYVVQHGHTDLPLLYKISAIWGGHEGSLLLWVLILAGWSALAGWWLSRADSKTIAARAHPASTGGQKHSEGDFATRVLGWLGLVSLAMLAFILLTSNPFMRLLPAADEGQSLNPLLQDPGLALHPPLLYLGYVGTAVPFAMVMAVLAYPGAPQGWVSAMRPFVLLAWAALSVGIALGSWWAYYELGWGGWWFWDPVENAAFMPWLVGAALIHSQAVTEKRGSFAGWTLLLAIAAFSLSLMGTFLVRSGVLTSVHAFAADPSRGLFILIFLSVVIGGSLLLYALRAGKLAPGAGFQPASRESLLLLYNLLLASACAMILLGTLYPLLADALEMGKISVGPPYFGLLFLVLMTPLVALVPFGPLTRWQRDQPSRVMALLWPWLLLALALGVLAFFTAPQGPWKSALGVAGAAWVILGTLRFAWDRLRNSGRMTAEMWGMVLAHVGIGVFLAGALLVEARNVQKEVALQPGQSLQVGNLQFVFLGVDRARGPNYDSDRGHVRVLRDGRELATLNPEKRAYAAGGQVMTEADIRPGLAGDIYVALGESLGDGAWAVRVHIKPFVRWIWLGALLMALGGLVTAADRRFRRLPEEKSA